MQAPLDPVRLPPVGFWSYARQDDELSSGKLSHLRSVLRHEVQQLFGRDEVRLFQDTRTIPHGSSWEGEIRKAISQSVFFVPILTPNFIQSEWCCREVELFLEREAQITSACADGRVAGRIFPILYIGIDEAEPLKPAVLDYLQQRQAFDFRRFRHRSYDEPEVREALSVLALNISRLLRIKLPQTEDEAGRPLSDANGGNEPVVPVAAVDEPAKGARKTRRRKPARAPDRPDGPSIAVGDVLNHMFEVTRFIKAGGMGQVFEGRNVKTGERVAIKALLPALAADPKIVKFFYREALTLTRLHHEAVVQYRVLAEEPRSGVLYIVTEYIDGVELSEAIGLHRPSPDQVLALTRRLASGLAAAHRLGAIHRDMSLDNVMLPDRDLDRAKIIDFGIAKDTSAGASTILGGAFAGKLGYAAPEQLGDHGGEVGTWTDVYSLGLVILAVARGEPVDMGRTLAEAVHKRREAIDLSALSEPLRPVVAHMLQPDPSARLRTMEDVIRSLPIAGLADSASASPSRDPPERPEMEAAATADGVEPTQVVDRPTTRRTPRAALFAGAIGVIVLLAAIVSMFRDRSNAVDATYAERSSPTAFNQAGGEAEQRALSGWGPLNTPSAQGQTGSASNQQVRPAVAAPCRAAGPYFAYFNQDQYTVGLLARAELDKLVAGRHPGHRITITGQNAGASGDTLMAARRRANEVAAYLAQRGVPRSTITVFASLEALGRVDGIHDREARRYMITAACG